MTDDREALGRAAYEAEVAFGHERAGAYTAADPWEALRPEVREMFMRIGSAAGAQAVAEAKARNERVEMEAAALRARLARAVAYCRRKADVAGTVKAEEMLLILGSEGEQP